MWREKLLGQEFDNLGQLAQRVAALNSQFQNIRRDTRFQKSAAIAETYNPYSVDDGYEDNEEEVAMAEWNWGKKIVMMPNPQGRGVEESYDFDITKLDKLFDFLLERGQIKLPANRVMLPPDQLKNKKFCNFITLLLILLTSAEFSSNIYGGPFSKESINLIHLRR